MKRQANQTHKRQRDELRKEKYFVAYSDLWGAINEIDFMMRNGCEIRELMAKIEETLVCNDALWHIYNAEEKALRNKQTRELRRTRKVQS